MTATLAQSHLYLTTYWPGPSLHLQRNIETRDEDSYWEQQRRPSNQTFHEGHMLRLLRDQTTHSPTE
ncbi:hypothetical protein E2C01_099375 [Portunus trituberculatus]|uniref:Uncharacterized protein n=1 Tax=Portunus trituberculatus TaxID=210409 RepID=A0A5B7KGP8_PORTR|nr:hypothetical protein [Portunus trituberculatus]